MFLCQGYAEANGFEWGHLINYKVFWGIFILSLLVNLFHHDFIDISSGDLVEPGEDDGTEERGCQRSDRRNRTLIQTEQSEIQYLLLYLF